MNAIGNKLQSIQVLRAFAAGVVLICHLQKEIRNAIGQTWLDQTNIEVVGQAGVDLFFVVSGFIMVYVTRDLPASYASVVNFLIKRIFRVVPLYWVLTFLTLAVTLVDPSVKNHNHLEIVYTIGSFLFIPFQREDGHFTPLLGVGWTLNYEMMFYVIFCFVLITRYHLRLAVFIMLFLAISLMGTVVPISMPQFWYWTRPIVLEFLAGGLIAHAFVRGVLAPTIVGVVAVSIGLAGLVWSGTLQDPTAYDVRFWAWGGPATLIVAGVVLAKTPIFNLLPDSASKFLERAGDGSYSLYLVHMFVIRGTTIALEKTQLEALSYTIACYAIAVTGSFVIADLLHRKVELPLSRFSRQFLLTGRNCAKT